MKVTHNTKTSPDGLKLTESSNGNYNIYGTNNNDKIELKFEHGHQQPASVGVYLNGVKIDSIPESQIKNLNIHAKDGNDTITIDPYIRANITINGGKGHDKITCNDKNTKVLTGEGNDQVNINKSLRSNFLHPELNKSTTVKSKGGTDTIRYKNKLHKIEDGDHRARYAISDMRTAQFQNSSKNFKILIPA